MRAIFLEGPMPDLRVGYIAALALLTHAPLNAQLAGSPIVEPPHVTRIAPGVVQLLDLLHWRLQDHAILPTREHVVCLTGRVTPDSTMIDGVSAALVVDAGRTWAQYRCPITPDLIGAWHNHPTESIGCVPSIMDLESFHRNPVMRVMMYSCARADRVTVFIAFRYDRHTPSVLRYEGQGIHGGPVLGRVAP
jgi:hypothetical protein